MRGMLSVGSQAFGGGVVVRIPDAHATDKIMIQIIKTALYLLNLFICPSYVNPFNCMNLPR
jgi:hypothetical protein